MIGQRLKMPGARGAFLVDSFTIWITGSRSYEEGASTVEFLCVAWKEGAYRSRNSRARKNQDQTNINMEE
jgi:hypothetical protein